MGIGLEGSNGRRASIVAYSPDTSGNAASRKNLLFPQGAFSPATQFLGMDHFKNMVSPESPLVKVHHFIPKQYTNQLRVKLGEDPEPESEKNSKILKKIDIAVKTRKV